MISRRIFGTVFLAAASAFGFSACRKGGGGVGADDLVVGKYTILTGKPQTDGADKTMAKKNAENTLLKYPDVAAMVGLWSYNSPQCLSALKDAGKVGKVKIFAFDEDEATLEGIKTGAIEGTIVQNPYEFGYQSMKYLTELQKGKALEELGIPKNKELDIPARTITKDNVGNFATELANLRAVGKQAESAPKPAANQRFAFVINTADSFWNYARAGCFKAEQDFGIVCDFETPSDGSSSEQNRILENILQKGGYNGVAVTPLDPDNQTSLLNEVAAKMPLLCHDSDAPKSNRRFYLGTNNVQAGRELGKLIKARMPEGGKIMVFVGKIDMLNAKQRFEGLVEELKK